MAGRKRTRTRIEDAERVFALDYARNHGSAVETRQTPTGDDYETALCPKCNRGARYFFTVEGVTACRKCLNLTYRRESESGTIAEKLRREPALIGEALNTLKGVLDTPNASAQPGFDEAMKTLSAAAQMQPAQPDTQGATDDVFAEIQTQIVGADLKTTTDILAVIEAQILSGRENYTDRHGLSSQVPMRPDALGKLVSAWATVANVRANRAGLATQITEKRNAGEGPESIRDAINRRLKERGHRAPGFISLEELESAEPLYISRESEIVEAEIVYSRDDEAKARTP